MRLLKTLGSLRFAICLFAGLVVILTASTCLESAYGTPFAQKFFYTAFWFDAFLACLAVNIVCSTLTRWPFQLRHTGFVVTHIGILLLLTGALLSRHLGVEGQMTLFEGEEKSRLLLPGHSIEARRPDGVERLEAKTRTGNLIPLPFSGADISLGEVLEHAKVERTVTEEAPGAASNRAVVATVSSGTLDVTEKIVLLERDPADPHAFFREIGPALFELDTKREAERPTLRVIRGGKTYEIPAESFKGPKTLGESGLEISNARYFGHAKLEGGRLVDAPDSVRFNPAIELELSDAVGRREQHAKFFLFPQFRSLRGGPSQDVLGVEVWLDAPMPEEMRSPKTPSFAFVAPKTAGGEWHYRVRSTRSGEREGAMKAGDEIQTGWMDWVMKVEGLFERAEAGIRVSPGGGPEAPAAARVVVRLPSSQRAGAVAGEREAWLVSDREPFAVSDKLALALRPRTIELPFSLRLLDFRKVDYPGTSNPSSFESDVSLTDATERLRIERTISMNKPLDHRSFRVFQSSYIQDPEAGEASVFSIAKNPGIGLIYSGGGVIFLGVILLFYLHPFFNRSPAQPTRSTRPKTRRAVGAPR